jgi:hypothetical protein
MKSRIRRTELDQLAEKLGLSIQHDCGGFRVTKAGRYLFPGSGICPTATARECYTFMQGIELERSITQAQGPDHWIT